MASAKRNSEEANTRTTLEDGLDASESDSEEQLDKTLVADPNERDEVKEIQKSSLKDTRRVNVLRLATTFVLLLTALLVTLTTYRFLKTEEKNNFETAVSCTRALIYIYIYIYITGCLHV